jgi:Protein of unknown function (DUF3386)
MTQTLTAENLFRSAYENRYTWDKQFPGYTCDVTFTTKGETHTAKVKINPDLKFEVSEIEDNQGKKAIEYQLWEMTIHRVNHSFEQSHGENTFAFGSKDEDGAVEILVGGAAEGNRYKVRNNVVSFVYRKMGPGIVCINTSEILNTPKGYLSQSYDSLYLDGETLQPKGPKTVFHDTFTEIEGYYVLTNRRITTQENGQPVISEYQFSQISFNK